MDTNDMGMNKFLIPAAVVLAGLFIGGAVIWNGSHPAQTAPTTGTAPSPSVTIKNVKTDNEPFIGSASAPVTMAYWSDYQCPFCKQFEITTLPQIIQDYVTQGKVKVILKDFQFLGPDSMVQAEFGRSIWANSPDKYFAWRTAMYANQPQENSMSASANLAYIQKITKGIPGLSYAQIAADVQAHQSTYDAAITADRTEATTMGIQATPSFIVGTQLIQGAEPYGSFKTALDTVAR